MKLALLLLMVASSAGACEQEAPAWPVQFDADGYLILPPIRAVQLDEVTQVTEVQAYVLTPEPTCWVLGFTLLTDADFDSHGEYEGEPVMEPVCRADDVGCTPP